MVERIKPWWPYLEATLFVALAVLANQRFFPDHPGYRDLPFSLFWVPILLIAGRYGTAPAAFTGVLCSLSYFYLVSLEQFLLGIFELTGNDKVMLFTFIFVALFMGQMYDRMKNRLIKLSHEHAELTTQFENLQLHHESLQLANQELEKKVIGRQSTFNSLYEMARGLESLDEAGLHKGVMELVRRFLFAERACLYLYDSDKKPALQGTIGYGVDDTARLTSRCAHNSLLQAALKAETPLVFRGPHEAQAKAPDGVLMAAPVRLLTTGETVGVICVDDMPFLAVNAGNLRLLGIIADWTAQSLEKARAYKDLQTRELDDQLTGVYSYGYFSIRIGEELNRAQRHQMVVSLMLIRVRKFDQMSELNQKDLLSIIGLVFQNSIREVDIACRFRDPQTFALILPLTDEKGAKILQDKLRFNIESYSFKPFDSDEELSLQIAFRTHNGQTAEGPRRYSVSEAQIKQFIEQTEQALELVT